MLAVSGAKCDKNDSPTRATGFSHRSTACRAFSARTGGGRRVEVDTIRHQADRDGGAGAEVSAEDHERDERSPDDLQRAGDRLEHRVEVLEEHGGGDADARGVGDDEKHQDVANGERYSPTAQQS